MRGPWGEWWGINNFETQLSGKSHCSQNDCPLPNESEGKINFHIYGPGHRGYSVQVSFKYELAIGESNAATYLPESSWHVANPVLIVLEAFYFNVLEPLLRLFSWAFCLLLELQQVAGFKISWWFWKKLTSPQFILISIYKVSVTS